MDVQVKNNCLEFRVQDTGIGIDKSMHHAIFERFRQADGNIAREFGGTGLGLSISKAYVELLGGKIWVDAEPGKGSTFFFTIPYVPVNTALEAQEQKTEVEMLAPDQQKTILIAEDEKFNYMLISEMFKGMNTKLIWAKNGWEVLQACHTVEKIDLVLMDMKMPVMDGFEATQMLRGFYPEIPIVAQTAYASEKEKQRILECGCNEMITKPFDVNQFRLIVNKYLSFNSNN
jgi:CheY-like chemotaxis protein